MRTSSIFEAAPMRAQDEKDEQRKIAAAASIPHAFICGNWFKDMGLSMQWKGDRRNGFFTG
jgi:hypothetical protein